jgi:wyosine [tRNA(Phe)-imidazoG37] synthetase (radical SAM superfamily)
MPIPLQSSIVYGPVNSRRLGASLGVNVLPAGMKTCNFNCPYCQYGWTPTGAADEDWPTPGRIARAVENALAKNWRVDRITLAGNGEPTLHPEFGEVVDHLRNVRRRLAPAARLAILSNAATASDPAVAAALGRLDERYMKLDAGDDATLRRLNASTVPIESIVTSLAGLDGIVLQSMFTRDDEGRVDNTTEEAVSAWLDCVRRIKPRAVHVYTIDRDPAWKALRPVPHETLATIVARLRERGVPAVAF